MAKKLKVLTVIGTRPEIIRLSQVIRVLDRHLDHCLVHTGQNYDSSLNSIFFDDLSLRQPDYILDSDTTTLGSMIGTMLSGIEKVILSERPDAFLVLGDTNSALCSIIAKRYQIPVYHMEAGNRSFDANVPEEVNRRIVDHVADYNLVYSEQARMNLLQEGISPEKIILTGSPMYEVLHQHLALIKTSTVLEDLSLTPGKYLVASIHRQENVDDVRTLRRLVTALSDLAGTFDMPVLVSTHPRTRKKLASIGDDFNTNLIFHDPFAFKDFIHLQQNAKLVISDSGTISEESSILGFPAITPRNSIERPESLDNGAITLSGVTSNELLESAELAISLFENFGPATTPDAYSRSDVSRVVLSFISSTARSHHQRNAIRAAN